MLTRYGGPDATELRDGVPDPSPGPDEVLVDVRAAGLNPVDFKTREGKLKVIRSYPLPAVMGNEISGVVASVGSRVTRFSAGDRVYARVDKDTMGGLAEGRRARGVPGQDARGARLRGGRRGPARGAHRAPGDTTLLW